MRHLRASVLCRLPTPEERTPYESFVREQTALYQSPPKSAPFPSSPAVTRTVNRYRRDIREQRLIQVLFNHNDFVTVR